MLTRRTLKHPRAFLSSLKKSPKYREMLRRAARKFHLESLEARQLFAVDPVLVAADGGVAFNSTAPFTVRNESPRELVFTFPGVPGIDQTTLANGIKLTAANKDGIIGNAGDLTITPAYLAIGNDQTQVVMRFATPLTDDLYQIQFIGATLKDTDGLPFNGGTNFPVNFSLNLAPQVQAVVPQPVVRDATSGALTQLRNQIHVYFNNDDLDVTRAQDPQYYRLLVTRGTVDPLDDAPGGTEITPTSVVYDPIKDKAVLTFSANIETFAPAVTGVADPAVAFRLRIGTNEIRRPNVYGVTGGGSTTDWLATDPGSTFDGAANLKNVLARGLATPQTLESFINGTVNSSASTNVLTSGTSVIIGQSIDPQYYNLVWPGGNNDPGHRNIYTGNHPGTAGPILDTNGVRTVLSSNDILENHLGLKFAENPLAPPVADADQVNGITTYYYNFRSELGYVPDTSTGTIPSQPTFNVITERQKQRAREALELIGQYAGVNFVETEQQGFIIATGDMRAILPTVQTGPGGLSVLAGTVDLNNDGVAETAAAIVDNGEDWSSNGADLYGNGYFRSALHGISEIIGLGHSYDLPSLNIQGSDPALSVGLPAAEPAFPGDGDIVHMQHVYRPESKDIDLYRFDIDASGVLSAEVFAERLANSSQLDSALSIYRVNPATQLPELYARNDDYFSKDAYIELQLEPGTYFVGVSASGNIEYDPNVADSGMGGTTQGAYQLKLDFRKVASQSMNDSTGIALDGNSDGKPGGVNNFWFRAAAPVTSLGDLQSTTRTARTIYVDRAGARPLSLTAGQPAPIVDTTPRDGREDTGAYANGGLGDGSLASPFLSIDEALAASKPYDIIRVVGNALAGTADTTDTNLADNLAYQIGFDRLGAPLADGATLDVPKDRTLVVDAGAVVQLRRAQISVGSENQGATADRSGGALQVFGTPWQNVYFTSYNKAPTGQTQIGKIENFSSDLAEPGNWGGLAFRSDIDQADGRFDFERRGIFMNYISNADIRYGGGQVIVNSTPRTVNPIHMTDARPTIINNKLSLNADAAMSANPDSFEESNFSSPQFGSTFNTSFNVDYKRVGPEIHGNVLTNNSVNAITIRSRTQSGTLNTGALEEMHVAGRFDDTDIVHVIQENLVMHSAPGGALVHTSLSAPGTALSVAAPAAGTGGFAAGLQSQIEYKLTYVDEFGNEGLASNTIRITAGSITTANSYVRLTNLPNITSALLAQGFVGRRLYRRIGGTGDFVLVDQIPASASGTYVDKNLPLPQSALRLKVAATSDTLSPRILANANLALPAVTTTQNATGGQYAAGQNVVYGLAYVDTEGRDTPMVELPAAGVTLGPTGSITINNLPATYGSYMGLRVYRSINAGQFDLVGLVDAGANSFVDTGAPLAMAQVVPATVNINAVQAAIVPALGGFSNGMRVNYRFTFAGTGGETASAALAVPAGELGGFVAVGNNRQFTLSNFPTIDLRTFSTLQIYRSINYGRFELISVLNPVPVVGTTNGTFNSFTDTNPANPAPTYLVDATLSPPATARARPHGSLVIDPSMIMKSDGARIDVGIGAGLIAEGVKGRSIIMTSLYDQRYGAGGTFATSGASSGNSTVGTAGDWAGIYMAPDSKGSFNEVVFAFGGGESRIEGTFSGINVLEIQQAKVRIANSRFENNDGGVIGDQAPADRLGRGPNDETTIFVRGAQPVIINNTVVGNQGSFVSINANGMSSANLVDFGRQTGLLAELPPGTPLTRISYPVSRLTDTQTAVTDTDNNGPLIRLNRLDQNEINGMRVRGGVLDTEAVWDDTDIVHVLFDSILIPDFHTYGGLRLESSARESLVVKAANDTNAGTTAGFIADGRPLEIEDRIGGTLQVLGQPGFPVVITSFSDDTISAGLTPSGKPQNNTNGDTLLPPLPTIGEVANGLRIDNDVATTVNGYLSYGVNAAGSYSAATGSNATAQGLVAAYNNVDLLFEHFPMVYVGSTAVDLRANVTVPPFLNGPDEVVSEGDFTGQNGLVHWKSTTKIANGSTRLTTTFQFSTTSPATLGSIRVIDYLDQAVGGANNDILYLYGSPGQADFRLLTLDNADRVGFAQGGVYTTGAGLQNAKYIGFMADKAPDLRTALLAGSLNTFGIQANATGAAQNVDVVDLPATADRALGNVFGTGDVTSAMAWDISPNATTSTVTTFLELFPRSPVTAGRPGEWAGIRIDEYANDRNVETVPEREPISSNGSQNSLPNKAQFLGSLASADKGGDENLRLGFVVQGAISTPSDVDVYSFKAKSETEVWFDIDRTAQSLDSVIELVDEFGNVLARSDNSADESLGADSLIGEGAFRMQKSPPYEGVDLYSTNVRDPGMRMKLPGPPGIESTYFVRIRSVPKNKADLDTPQPASINESKVTKGISSGAYELQVRLRETDEKGGTTIRYAKIANAATGIDINGLPTHSPLGGEQRDEEPNNIGSLLGAQELGNLLNSDRGAISVGGTINTVGETDWYTFTLDYTNIDGNSPVAAELPSLASLVNTVFDLDYADGLARPNMQMFVFDAGLNLILSNFDSNIADDRGNALAGGALSDLGRGSIGFNDSFIGNVALPASTPFGGAPQRYYVAVMGVGTTPTVLDQFTNRASTNPLLRIEPLDSVHRIVEDHLNEGTFANPRQFWATGKPEVPVPSRYLPFLLAGLVPPDRGTSDLPSQEVLFDQVAGNNSVIPWHLGDTTLYLLRDSGAETTTLDTINPFTGVRNTVVGSQPFDIRDIEFNGTTLQGLTRDIEVGPMTDALSGHLISIATTNGAATDLGGDGIITYEPAFGTSGPPVVSNGGALGYGIHYNAMAYGGGGRLYGVGQRGEAYLSGNVNPLIESRSNLVYQLQPALVDTNAARDDGAWTDAVEAGEIFTEFKFTAAESTNTYRTNPNIPFPSAGYFTLRNLATNPNVQDPATGNDALISQTNATFNIRDGEQITVTDGDTTHVFEFDAGFDYVQTIQDFADNTVRDGYYFILDADDTFSTTLGGTGATRNEAIYQFDTGPVITVNPAINSANIPDQSTFTIQVGGTSKIFEFDKDGKTLAGTIPITLAPAPTTPPVPPPILSSAAIAALIQDAINGAYDAATFPVTAYSTGAAGRVSLFPDNAALNNIVVSPLGFSDTLRYLDPPSQGGAGLQPFLLVSAEGANGAAPVLQALPQPAVPGAPGDLDGKIFTINQPNLFPGAANNHVFEFQLPGTPAPAAGRIPVPINYGDTGSQVAAAMRTAISTLTSTYSIQANQYNNDDRVVVNGLDVTFSGTGGPIVNLMATQANGGLMTSGGILIGAKEAYPYDPAVDLRTTGQRIADAVMTAVNTNANSPFIVGAEAGIETGRVNFPPLTNIAGRVPVKGIDVDGNPTWTGALDDTGNPNSFGKPGVSTGAIPIPFLAFESASLPSTGAREAIDPITGAPVIINGAISQFSIAARVEAAIDTYLTPSTGIIASSQGPFVTLNRGRIVLPPSPNTPFASRGPIINTPTANPPGGDITGMVYLPEISTNGVSDYFLATSDKGGLYEVRVDWLANQNLPVKLPNGDWNTQKRLQVTTTYIDASEFDLSGIRFQGLTRGPANVEIDPVTNIGRYTNTWFAVADDALIQPPNSIVAPGGFTESEQNNAMPRGGGQGQTDESFVTHLVPNALSGTQSVYRSVMTNGVIGNGAFSGPGNSGDYDFYHFQANVGETVTVEVQGAGTSPNFSLVDSAITIYNAAGTPVASDDNGGNGFDAKATFTVQVNSAGDYYVAVRSGGTSRDLLDPFAGNRINPTTLNGSGPNFTGTYGLTITRQVDSGSILHAFQYNPVTSVYGGMQPVFADGNTSMPLVDRLGNRIQDAVGLRFGELQQNLWTMTPYNSPINQHRQYDPGHGMDPVAHEGGAPDSDGHSSFYFGRSGVGSVYNYNNGAAGSIVSNEFSLEGYSAIDQPTLYFSYFSDHEISPIYDSLRLFISGIGDNNADRDSDGVADTNSGDWTPISFDDQGANQTFTGTGSWRQVRVPLDGFAGQQGLRLRFDFSTAGDMDVGNTFTTGEEIRTVSGEFITDGQFIQIDNQVFELNSGVTATFSSGRATPDGETITLTDALGVATVFEFDKNGAVGAGATSVLITDEMSPQEVTQALLRVLTAQLFSETSFLGVRGGTGAASTISDAVLTFHGVSAATAAPPAGSPVGTTPVTLLTGAVGINDPEAIELPYRRDDSRTQVASTLQQAIQQFNYEQQLVVNTGSAYVDGQTFDLTDTPRTITGQPTPAATTTTFEFEAGEIIDFPDDGADNTGVNFVVDGDVFEVTWNTIAAGAVTRRFEFDNDGLVTGGNVRVPFTLGDSDTIVSNSVALALVQTFPGMQARVVSNSRVQLDTDTNATTFANFADPTASGKYTVIGAVGVTPGNQTVFYTESNGFSVSNVAGRIASSINAAGIAVPIPGSVPPATLQLTASTSTVAPNRVILNSALDYVLNPNNPPNLSMAASTVNNVKQYNDLVRLISSGIGAQHTVVSRGPFGLANSLAGDVSDAAGGMASNLRGQNNNFEGVYLDDFVIGLAERGEMFTGVTTPVTTTVTVPPLDPSVINQVRLGDYQLEIRRGVAYDFTELDVTSFTPDSNDRFAAQQTLVARDGATIVDGQSFTLSDGVRQLTFEFNDINQIPPAGVDSVSPGNQRIDYNSTMKDYEVAAAIRDAINSVDVQQILTVNAWMADGVQPGLITTTNRVNLNGAATLVATGVPVLEPNQNIASALEITGAGVPYDGLRFFANGTIGDSDDNTTSQNDAGRRDRDVDYFGLDLVAGQRIVVDVDASINGSTLDSYLRIFNAAGTLQNVTINGVTYTAENDGPTIPMLFPAGGFSTVTFAAPGEANGGASVIGNGLTTRPDTDSALVFTAPAAGRYYIAVSGAGNNRYNPVTGAGAIPGSKGTYQLEVTSPNAADANSAGINSAIDTITYDQQYGDRNLPRDQGQLIIQGNEIYNSLNFGIDIDAGARVAGDGNAAHQGGVRNLSQSNATGLLTGVVVMNNVIYGNGLGGISFSGDPLTDAPVPYGRIVNNTLYGQGGNLNPPATPVADVGIRVTERAGPTLLNNIIVNFNTAVAVDATSRPNTVIGGIVTQGNNILSTPANIGFGDFPILLNSTRNANGTLVDPLFRNPAGANFYLDNLSRAIDSSVDSLLDRTLMVTIKAPLGLGESPILSPDRDSRGQVRADDPAVQTPQGFGLNPFKDRGAIDRVDKDGPGSNLLNPQDNDSFGIDRDSALTVVSTDTTAIIRNFTISLIDQTNPNGEPDGSDIDDFTVTSNQVIVTRRTNATTEQVLQAGVDYFFSYDTTSNLIVLTPVGNVWTRGTYRIYLNDGILDQAGNKLVENHSTSLPNPVLATDTINHYYDIFLGTAVDYGDAPAAYPVLAAANGANHFITPGVYIGNPPTADFDGQPAASAALDNNDDGVTFGNLLPGVVGGSQITVNSPTAGLKLSAWFDNDGTVGWGTNERVLTNYVLTAGSNVINFTIPNGARGATYARFRVSTLDIPGPTGGTSSTGAQLDGEVEDYLVTITGPAFQNSDTIIVNIPGVGPTNVGNLDVNDNGFITAFDALIVINYLNLYGATALPIVNPPAGMAQVLAPPPFLDTNGSGTLNSFDALLVINYLNLVPLTPPVGPEDVSVGGGAAPEATDVAGEATDGEQQAALQYSLVPDTMYASSSIILDEVPVATPQGMAYQSPVADLLDDQALEMILVAMAERGELGDELVMADEAWQDDVSVGAGPLTDGQWADLLDDLAAEQAAQA